MLLCQTEPEPVKYQNKKKGEKTVTQTGEQIGDVA
jgi:hypothetical protein